MNRFTFLSADLFAPLVSLEVLFVPSLDCNRGRHITHRLLTGNPLQSLPPFMLANSAQLATQ